MSGGRWLIAGAVLLCSCSDGSSAATTSTTAATTAPAGVGALPRVDLIDDAVAALEAKLGAPQQFFEINATPQLVNLFVALNDGKLVQPWVYLDGELSSTDGRDATGHSFAASALDFDPAKVLGRLKAELPDSTPDVFFVEGGEGGTVRYSVAITSSEGGQLVVVLGPDGAIESVDT